MLMIRLQRVGKKHDPSFRIVLTDSRKGPKSGSFLEVLGNYNAQKGEPQFKNEKIKHWISKGAQISNTVHNLLIRAKIIGGDKIDVLHHERIKKAIEKNAPAPVVAAVQAEVKTEEPTPEVKEEVAVPVEEAPAVEPIAEETNI